VSSVPDTRPLRADARRNREKVLDSARAVFAEYGPDAQMDEVARRACVGVGTVYRHFPTKDALARALVEEHFARLAAEARRLLEEEPDAWTAVERMLLFGAQVEEDKRGLMSMWAQQPAEFHARAARETGLYDAMAELIARAQAAGAMRTDATVDDVPLIMCALGRVIEGDEQGMPGSWQRFLALVLDGLRGGGARPLP
jgi:AcrR family transcriptional regulator